MPKEKRCDGYLDCRNGRDEEGCSGISCRLDQFRCANGLKCIDAAFKCNHKDDCGDKSDEQGCSKYMGTDFWNWQFDVKQKIKKKLNLSVLLQTQAKKTNHSLIFKAKILNLKVLGKFICHHKIRKKNTKNIN